MHAGGHGFVEATSSSLELACVDSNPLQITQHEERAFNAVGLIAVRENILSIHGYILELPQPLSFSANLNDRSVAQQIIRCFCAPLGL